MNRFLRRLLGMSVGLLFDPYFWVPFAFAYAVASYVRADEAVPVQCPPGAKSCPNPMAPTPSGTYTFRGSSGNPAPWTTAVRITAELPGNARQLGSGTVIDPSGLVMTCAHVLRGSTVLRLELFGATLDRRTGSIGPPVASFAAVAIARDDALDVGLVRFDPGDRTLPASPLVPEGWRPAPGERLCSVGCSGGADPTAISNRYVGPSGAIDGHPSYVGLVCDQKPKEGRSGGGLFDESGRLAGVCDFADPNGTGIYAAPTSLREILARDKPPARKPKPQPSAPEAEPEPDPMPSAPMPVPSPTLSAPVVGMVSASGGGLLAFLASRLARGRRRPSAPREDPDDDPGPDTAPGAPASLPSTADCLRMLAAAMRRDEEEARAAREREEAAERDQQILAGFRELIGRDQAPNP